MLRVQQKRKVGIALLYSTDTVLNAMTLVSHYKARFQIECIFRDAKQERCSFFWRGASIVQHGFEQKPGAISFF